MKSVAAQFLEALPRPVQVSTMASGLQVMTVNTGSIGMYLSLGVRVGGYHDQLLGVPFGTTHFLEHVLSFAPDGGPPEVMRPLLRAGVRGMAETHRAFTRHRMEGPACMLKDALKVLGGLLTDRAAAARCCAPAPVARERKRILDEIGTEDPALNPQLWTNMVFLPEHPWRHISVAGTPESIPTITGAHLLHVLESTYIPNNAVLVAVGGVDHDQVLEQVAQWGGVPGVPQPAMPILTPTLGRHTMMHPFADPQISVHFPRPTGLADRLALKWPRRSWRIRTSAC